MPFRFKKSSCVVVGSFNVYIIQPKWLSDRGLIGKGETKLQSDMRQPGFRFQRSGESFQWVVRPDRIAIESDAPDADCGDRVARLLEILPWTPVFGVGNNIEFVGKREDLEALGLGRLPPRAGLDNVTQRSWHVAVARQPSTVNLQISELSEGSELSANWHTGLTGKPIKAACDAAARFLQDCSDARGMFATSFDAPFED